MDIGWPGFVDGRWIREVSREEIQELLLLPPDGRLTGECSEALAILEAHGLNGTAWMAFPDQLETRCRRALGGDPSDQ